MAKYTVTYKCGHTATIQLFGKYDDRERKIAYYKTIDCPECKAKAAAEKATEQGLAALTGSPKQVAWAEQIRAKFVELAGGLKKRGEGNGANPQVQAIYKVLDETMQNENASFWIDNRFDFESERALLSWCAKRI